MRLPLLPLALLMRNMLRLFKSGSHRRLQQFAKAKEHLKRRCGMVTPSVKGEPPASTWLFGDEWAMHSSKFETVAHLFGPLLPWPSGGTHAAGM